MGHARFCAVCGSKTVQRDDAALKEDLTRVRWLLGELPRWDSTAVDGDARAYVDKRYRYVERVLLSALEKKVEPEVTPAVVPPAAPPKPAVTPSPSKGEGAQRAGGASLPSPVVAPPEQKRFVLPDPPKPEVVAPKPPPPPPPAPKPEVVAPKPPPPRPAPKPKAPAPKPPAVPAAVLAAKPPRRTLDDRLAVAASHWHRVWKPFLNESIGWFVGGFLILAGTLYLVFDSWKSMGDAVRAGVVFGLAAGWTLGFTAWGRFLSRREKTKGAARVLKLISAMMAPLAPLAIGPALGAAWFVFIPACIGWAGLSAWLAAKVEPDYDAGSSPSLPTAMGLSTAMMGLAPLFSHLHASAETLLWLNVIPAGLLVVHASRARKTLAQRGFAFAAMAYATTLFAARLHYELGSAVIAPSAYAPFVAIAAIALVRMRTPGHAADLLSVSAVALQVAALAIGLFIGPPGFFIAAAAGTWTCWTLTRERLSNSHRWLYGAYGFGYFAWQSCGQLVPGFVKQLAAQLRGALGYGASASLPPSYDAAYAAVFVIAVGFFAMRALPRHGGVRKLEAEVVLRCTWVTALLAGALGMAAVGSDVRPALFSAPFLAAFELYAGLKLDRPAHTRAGAALLAATAAAAALGIGVHHELTLAAFALLAAVASIPWTLRHRQALGIASVALITVSSAIALTTPATLQSTLALLFSGVAAVLVSLNLERQGLVPATGLLLAVAPRLLMVLAPDYAPLALALAAVVAAAMVRKTRFTAWTSALAAGVALFWQLGVQSAGGEILYGPVALCAALALALGVVRDEKARFEPATRDVLAMLLLGTSLITAKHQYQAWSGLSPALSAGLAAALALTASVWTFRLRSWRPVLLASVAIAVAAWAALVGLDLGHHPYPALGFGVALLLSSRALTPRLTLPVSSLMLMSFSSEPAWWLGCAALFTALALMRETRAGRVLAGPRRRFAGPASLAAAMPALLLGVSVLSPGHWLHQPQANEVAMAALAALLPFAWARATRNPGWLLAAPVLFAAGLRPLGVYGNLVLSALTVAFTRALSQSRVREAFFPERALGREDADVRAEWANRLVLASAVLVGLLDTGDLRATVPLALALCFAATDGLALRLFFAAGVATLSPVVLPYAALAGVAIAFTSRHAPKTAARLFGTADLTLASPVASVLAVLLATIHCLLMPAGAVVPAALLAFTLLAAAVILGFGVLVFASASALVFLPNWDGRAFELGGVSLGVTVVAALAAVLRYPPLGARVDALVARLGRPVERSFAFWLWLAGMSGVALSALLGTPELCVALLLPAALLMMTPARSESASAIALLASLVVFRLPAPLSSALLSGGAVLLALGARHGKGKLDATWTWASRALSVVSVAPAFLAASSSPGAVLPSLTLAATLFVCALTWRVGLFTALATCVAVVAPAFDGRELNLSWLVPAATVAAGVAGLLRLRRADEWVERLEAWFAPPPHPWSTKLSRPAGFWPWAGALAAVALAALSAQSDYVSLLLPAALLLSTGVAVESAVAFGFLGALSFFRVPAPLSCALLSGSALALQLGARHGEGELKGVWKWTARSFSLAAIGPALLYQSQAQVGLAAPGFVLAATLVCAALVLRLRALFTVAALSAVVLPALDGRHLAFDWLVPAATLTALIAALLRLPAVVKASERFENFVAAPLGAPLGELDRSLAFWFWLGAALTVCFGALSAQPGYLALLLPAALLLATDVALESMVAFGILGAVLVFRAPVPLACALLSGTALALQLGSRHGRGQLDTAWKWTARALSVAAVIPAALQVLGSPAGATAPALTLAATLLFAALVTGVGPLFTASAVAAVVLPSFGGESLQLGWLSAAATVVASLAALLRLDLVKARFQKARAFVAEPLDTGAAGWFWLAAAISTAFGALAGQADYVMLLLPAGLLLITETTLETATAISLLSAVLMFRVPAPLNGAVLAALGLAFSFGGRRGPSARSQTWFHAGWALALIALPCAHQLSSPFTPLAWMLSAGTAWVVANERPELEWLGWSSSLAAGHVGLFFLGVTFSTGAPQQLILPWVASFSLLLGALAMVLGTKSDARARLGQLMMAFGLAELSLGVGLLPGAHPCEAVVVCVALVLASGPLFFRAGKRDDALASVLSGLVPAMLLLTVHLVGLGGRLGSFEAFSSLVLGVIAGGLHDVLRREKKPGAARVALAYALLFPIAGLVAAPHQAGWTLAGLLLAQSLHYAWFSRLTGSKLPAIASAVAFNAAMVCGWLSSGFHSWEYLAIPFGLSLLGLVKVFGDELPEGARVKLRAVAVTLVYAAASVRPLTFDHALGLFVCVFVCVVGIAAGIALKVRSYVYLGTAFMVTSVVANLVRFGVREPRVGAIFLSSLGLLVVGFMVLVTTKRAELLERYKATRAMLQQWDG
ncbi:MAG: hypothetical protein QM723_23105 [Myxococcaceae bacterium]